MYINIADNYSGTIHSIDVKYYNVKVLDTITLINFIPVENNVWHSYINSNRRRDVPTVLCLDDNVTMYYVTKRNKVKQIVPFDHSVLDDIFRWYDVDKIEVSIKKVKTNNGYRLEKFIDRIYIKTDFSKF